MLLALICRIFLRYGPSYTHRCRTLTVVLARLSYYLSYEIWTRCTERVRCILGLKLLGHFSVGINLKFCTGIEI